MWWLTSLQVVDWVVEPPGRRRGGAAQRGCSDVRPRLPRGRRGVDAVPVGSAPLGSAWVRAAVRAARTGRGRGGQRSPALGDRERPAGLRLGAEPRSAPSGAPARGGGPAGPASRPSQRTRQRTRPGGPAARVPADRPEAPVVRPSALPLGGELTSPRGPDGPGPIGCGAGWQKRSCPHSHYVRLTAPHTNVEDCSADRSTPFSRTAQHEINSETSAGFPPRHPPPGISTISRLKPPELRRCPTSQRIRGRNTSTPAVRTPPNTWPRAESSPPGTRNDLVNPAQRSPVLPVCGLSPRALRPLAAPPGAEIPPRAPRPASRRRLLRAVASP